MRHHTEREEIRMTKFELKRASNPEKLRVYIPDTLHAQITELAHRSGMPVDDVVAQCLAFAVRQLRQG